MNNRLYISFFLNKRSSKKKLAIYLRITIAGVRQSVHTGVFVTSENWDSSKGRVKASDEEFFVKNNLLLALQTRSTEIYIDLIKEKVAISSHAIRSRLVRPDKDQLTLLQVMEEHNKYVKRRVGTDVSKATCTKYRTLTNKVQFFLKSEYRSADLLISDLNRAFLVQFELHLKAAEHIGHNTAIKYIQFLKRVINYGIAMEWFHRDPFKSYKCSIKPVIRDYLIQSEIDVIRTKEMPRASLDNVRKLFIFSCYTGLAYADLKKLNQREISIGFDGNLWIQTHRAKTTTRVQVPLLPEALNILPKNVGGDTSLVFHVPSNQKVNEALKDIAGICGISKKLSFHIARHTFATTITLSNGVPIETLSKMLGHTNIKTTQIYGKIVEQKISEDMAILRDRLLLKAANSCP